MKSNTKKDCAFQYCTGEPYKNIEDTPLITLEEAKALWRKYLPDFIEKLQDNYQPEMAIWIDMNDPYDYRTTLAHVNKYTETDGVKLYERHEVKL